MLRQRDALSGISHDVAQELLGSPRLLLQKYSFDYDPHTRRPNQSKRVTAERRPAQSSGAWTTLSREAWPDQDEVEDRHVFVEEYNCLAKMHNVRLIIPDDCNSDSSSISEKPNTWISRILRRTSSTNSTKLKAEREPRHKRSISDISHRRASTAKNTLQDKNLQDLVRLCGLSLLYLPTEFAPCSLAVPTCFRATAQYLVQHGPGVPGIFRIPGSNNVVAALYHYYCARGDEEDIAGTVRCPSLPTHIKYIVHDVASTFKRFLSGVPGGILGSLALFDALVSIQNQLRTDPDVSIRRQTLIRSRLIALAIATLKSQYRRELICAVFGLLSMIGYASEANYSVSLHSTLPATELMGCGQLGIVFGPLLIGDLLDNYNMRVPNPYGGLILLPITPPRSRKERQKSSKSIHNTLTLTTRLDKIKVANCLTEMLIIHWRDVVDYLKSSQALRIVEKNRSIGADASKCPLLRPSASEAFPPRVWDNGNERPIEYVLPDQPRIKIPGMSFPQKRRSKSQPVIEKGLSGPKSKMALSKPVKERANEISAAPKHSRLRLQANKISHTQLDHYMLDKSLSPTNSDQDSVSVPAIKRRMPGSEMRNSESREQHLPLRPPRRQSARSMPERYAVRYETYLSPNDAPSPKPTANKAISQSAEDEGLRRRVVAEPYSSDPGLPPIMRDSYCSSTNISIRPQAGPLVSAGAAIDHLSKASPQEDLNSLVELARVLSQGWKKDENRSHDLSSFDIEKDRRNNGIETASINRISIREEGVVSSASLNQKLLSGQRSSISKGHESSTSSSSPLSLYLSRRRGWANKLSSSKMATIKAPESTDTASDVLGTNPHGNDATTKYSEGLFRADLSKMAVQRSAIDSPIRASPRGTVKALVAKFSSGVSPLAVASPATKASVADVQVDQNSPRESIVSPYTRNPPSPARSQKPGISDRQAREVRKLPKADPHLYSPQTHSPFCTPVSQQQISYSTNGKLTSRISRRSVERIVEPTEEPLIGTSLPVCLPDISVSTNTLLGAFKPVKEVCLPEADISRSQIASHNPVLVTGHVSQRKSWTSSRNISVLHGQIQALQQQLNAKTEEVRQLKQQLEARSNPDVGTLAESIMAARREIQLWKSRAELLEKQVEMTRNTSARSSAGQGENWPAKDTVLSDHSTTGYSESAGAAAHRNLRVSRLVAWHRSH